MIRLTTSEFAVVVVDGDVAAVVVEKGLTWFDSIWSKSFLYRIDLHGECMDLE